MGIMKKKLPIGIENFEEIISERIYYIDKTGLIRELLQSGGKVTLFTRPRRFGKSLNMSMLECFFDLESNKNMFEGLEISKETELCERYMGKFPVISISLKSIDADSYETAYKMAVKVINEEAAKRQYLLKSSRLTSYDKDMFCDLLKKDMDESTLFNSLREFSRILKKHHNQKVILLIDEYDVPLAKAYAQGYYDQMVFLIRSMFHQALKTNSCLQSAVLTGCLQIAKESIFTGLNNMKVLSIADVRFDEYFGFTDSEVRELLDYYQLSDKYGMVREWYDGYHFGNAEVYCPWDVINYCDLLLANPEALPENYWTNTSSNDAVRRFIQEADDSRMLKREIESLIAGETIIREVHLDLTYRNMFQSIDNLWSLLFTTGYLTQKGIAGENCFHLAIPNMEIRRIFVKQIMELFKEKVKKDGTALEGLCRALQDGNPKDVERQFNEYLDHTISIRDTFARKQLKENFYHGILLGIIGFKNNWVISSNKESGDGYSDILIEIEEDKKGIVIEMKYAQDGNLDKACGEALEQIETKHYDESLYGEDIDIILKYGIACYKKKCKVILEREADF